MKSVAYILCLGFLISGIGLSIGESADERVIVGVPAMTPINVTLEISKIPLLDEPTRITCKVVSDFYDSPNATAEVILPPEAELITGDLSFQGDLKADEPIYLNSTIRFAKEGDYQIEARAIRYIDPENSWGDIEVIYLTIGATQSLFTPAPEFMGKTVQASPADAIALEIAQESFPANLTNQMEYLPLPEPLLIKTTDTSTEIVDESSKAPLGTLTVTGRFGYWTKLSDYRNDDPTQVWAKWFYVMVVDGNNNFLGSGWTDTNGYFSINVANPGSTGIRVRFYTYSALAYTGSPTREFRVVYTGSTLSGLNDVYWWTTGLFVFSDGTHNIGNQIVAKGDTNEGACWLLEDLIRGYSFPGKDSSGCTIKWYPTSTDGTYYALGGQVHLKGEDKKSADTAIHEYAHNVMWTVYGDWFPPTYCPSPHYINKYSHPNCGWTEGFADFYPLGVNGNPTYTWASGSSLNLETPTWGTAGWDNGDGVEGRVAGALYDIYDSANDGYDNQYFWFDEIRDLVFNLRHNRFSEFWNAWVVAGYSQTADRCLYQNTISYLGADRIYYPDFTDTNDPNSWRSWLVVENHCGSPSLVYITLKSRTGALLYTGSSTIPAYSVSAIRPRTLVGSDCSGSAVIKSSQPIVGTCQITRNNNDMCMSYNAFTKTATTLILPDFTDTNDPNSWRSWFVLQNPGSSTASIDIVLKSRTGATLYTGSSTIPAGSVKAIRPSSLVGSACSGSAKIVSTQPIVGTCQITRNNNEMCMSYSAFI